jgi:hypothetical protein
MEQELLALLKQTVSIAGTTTNKYDEQVPGTPTSYPARVEYNNVLVKDSQGKEVVSKAQVILDGTVSVGSLDEITLPDGTKPIILSIEKNPDETGNIHHVVVYT